MLLLRLLFTAVVDDVDAGVCGGVFPVAALFVFVLGLFEETPSPLLPA